MKKISILILILFLIQGCSITEKKERNDSVELYHTYYNAILDQDKFSKDSPYFSISASIDEVKDEYVYEVIVDDAKIAMYDVKILVVENQKQYDKENKMMPSAGIFDDKTYKLIPNQSRTEEGYVSGFQLLGELDEDHVDLDILVIFTDYRKLETYREFIEFTLDLNEVDEGESEKDDSSDDEKDSEESNEEDSEESSEEDSEENE